MTTTTTNDLPAARRTGAVVGVCVLAGVAAAAATELYAAAARAAGISLDAGLIGATEAAPITVGAFAMGTVASAFVGTVLAVLLARFATDPARTWTVTTVVLTALSMIGPVAAGATSPTTKVTLALAHALAAAIIIPAVRHRLGHVAVRADTVAGCRTSSSPSTSS
jgi:hypothetical protein